MRVFCIIYISIFNPGIHLGAILASVSPAVVVPTVSALGARGLGVKHQIPQLVANAGGLDTAFSEGMFGVINSAIFFPSPPYYRIVKVFVYYKFNQSNNFNTIVLFLI